jgi:ABC-type multidrug transport system permease subunit
MRLRELWRQPATLFWVFGFPILLSLALGAAFHERGREPIVVGSVHWIPPATIASLGADGVIVLELSPSEAARQLRAGRISLIITPPERRGAAWEVRYDPARQDALLARATVREALQRPGRADLLPILDHPVDDAGWRYIDFLVPGLLGMNLMTGALWGVGWSLADLRVRKLLKRLRASPMRPRQLLLAIALARGLVVPVEAAALLLFARLVFGSPVAGSIPLLALVVVAGSLAFSGIGVLVGSRAESGEVASGLINLVMLPMFVASGIFFSASHFPEVVQPLIRLLPLTAVNDALRAVILEAATLQDVAWPLIVLAAWAAAAFTVGLRLFRWS